MKNIHQSFFVAAFAFVAAVCLTTVSWGQIQLPEIVNDSNNHGCRAKIYYHIKQDMITVGDSLQPDPNQVVYHEYTSYQWYFGDGDSAHTADAIHEYQASGEYTITLYKSFLLTIGNAYCRKKYTFKVSITVDYCKPKIKHYSKNNMQYFVARAKTGVKSFTWRLGNGSWEGDSIYYSYQFESDGLKEVCLRTDATYPTFGTQLAGSCTSDTCFFINVIDTSKTCISDIIVTKKAYKTYQFFDTLSWLQGRPIIMDIGGLAIKPLDTINRQLYPCDPVVSRATYWIWDFGDGNKDINPKAVHKYQKAGKYKASLTKYHYSYIIGCNDKCYKYDSTLMMIAPCFNMPKCTETKYFDVVVDSLGCQADFTYKWIGSNKMLFTDISKYSNGSDSTVWDFGDGTKGIGKQVVHAFKFRPKEYKVCMDIRANGCIADGICGDCMLMQCRRIVMNGDETPVVCEQKIFVNHLVPYDSIYKETNENLVSLKLSPNNYFIDNGSGKSTIYATSGIWYIMNDTIVRTDSDGFTYTFAKQGTYPICVDYTITRHECYDQECIKTIECQKRTCIDIVVNKEGVSILNNVSQPQSLLKSKLFPNPARENVKVEVGELSTNFDLVIYNNAGSLEKRCNNMNASNNVFNAKDIKPGLYFYNIISEGKIVSKDKFQKE